MKFALICTSACFLSGIASAQILNPSFETEASGGSFSFLVNSTPSLSSGLSAAADWNTFLYSAGVLDTNWVPAGTQAPNLTGQGNSMLYVSDSGNIGGIYATSATPFTNQTVSV